MPSTLDIIAGYAWLAALPLAAVPLRAFRRIRGSRRRGWIGERAVASVIAASGHERLSGVGLPLRNGFATADHVVLAGGAIVVVTAHDHLGAILPGHGTIAWTAEVADGRMRSRFPSPLESIRPLLKGTRAIAGPECPVVGLCVFSGGASFPSGVPEGVVTVSGLAQELRRIAEAHPPTDASGRAWSRLASRISGASAAFEATRGGSSDRKAA